MGAGKVIVSKFGGSSMADATAISRSAKIAFEKESNIIVVSATYGTTNELIELSQVSQSGNWEKTQELLEKLRQKHITIARDLDCSQKTVEAIETILREAFTLCQGISLLKDCNHKTMDSLYSVGERVSSHLMATALRRLQNRAVEFFDIREVLKTDDQFSKATPNVERIKELSNKHLLGAKYYETVYVTQGFIGSTEEGHTTTLGRGGSDYSAALIAEGINADLLEIWTDVAGIATTDPRIVPEARPINEITFQEAAELANFGAKILHPTTLTPAMRSSIPVFVGSSYEPNEPGTIIRNQCDEKPLVRAMALKKDQRLLTITTPKMLNAHGFLAKVFGIFDKYQVSIDAITTSEISVAMTVNQEVLANGPLINELSEYAKVEIEENLALVSLIGNNINHTAGLAQNIFSALNDKAEQTINVRMICLGASKHNFCFLVQEKDAPEAISRLHKALV